jgi:hypothetical protein
MANQPKDFSGDIDALYQVPLTEFTAARNALAARVKGEQGTEAANAIKALQKPSIPAWVVNQLYWRDRREFEKLTKAGDRLRLAQQQRLAGHGDPEDLRVASAGRQEAIQALNARAKEVMRSGGLTLSPDMLQRISTTIESLSAYGSSEAAPRAGRLVEEVAPPGLEALAALIPTGGSLAASLAATLAPPESAKASKKGKADLRVVETRQAEQADKAKSALAAAETAVTEARDTAKQATAEQEAAEAAWTKANQALQEARRVLDEAMDAEREAVHRRDAARREATQASHALERAERARDAAERNYQAQAGS